MKSETKTLKDHDGVDLYLYKWLPEGPVRGVLQIAHGMQEHAGRYEHLAEALTQKGYAVYAHDQRGHGHSVATVGELGILGPGGWKSAVLNLKELTDLIKEEHPGKPVFLLGHSFGSFLSQAYLQRWGKELKGAILSGTNGTDPLVKVGVPVAWTVSMLRGKNRQAWLLDKLTLGQFNKSFEPKETGFEWLNRDKSEVQKFADDPLCGTPFPNSFFLNLAELVKHIWNPANEKHIPTDLPLYLFAGTHDPVGNRTRGIDALISRYRKRGHKDITHRYYTGGRHEMLNEINKDEVIRDLIAWIEEKTDSQA